MSERGLLVTVEGGDGSGKATQANLTRTAFENVGRPVYKTSFPRYGQESAIYVEKYLNGEYGDSVDALPPEVAGVLFAVDRMAGTQEIETWLKEHPDGIAVLDRYIDSNQAHQGAKIGNTAVRHAFYKQLTSYETNVLGILVPDLNIVLNVPPKIAQLNVDAKDKSVREYTTRKRDIHEADAEYLEKVKACYAEIAAMYPDTHAVIECVDESTGEMRSREDIQAEIQLAIAPLLK
ncbi:hypothetical protein I8H83_00530 [Candidatus Saccharibacteria bacterium]|nr:hypothetical protein [Candidatus Saccharibacteria bacterium]